MIQNKKMGAKAPIFLWLLYKLYYVYLKKLKIETENFR
jgi:hypothetical protein